MRRPALPRALLAAAALVGAVVVAFVAFLDARQYNGHAMRNVSVIGRDVGGMSRAELDHFIDELEAEYRRTPVRVATAFGGFSAPGEAFGISIDHVALRSAVLRASRGEGFTGRFSAYWKSFVVGRDLDVPVRVDVQRVEKALQTLERNRADAVDPKLVVKNNRFSVVEGSDGFGISPSALASALAPAARKGLPITVSANPVVLRSNWSEDDLQSLVDDATEKTSVPLRVRAGGRTATVPTAELRAWVEPAIVGRKVVLSVDGDAALAGVRRLLGSVGTAPRNARITLDQNGRPIAMPSASGTRCCTAESLQRIERALGDPEAGLIDLELETVPPEVTTEEVASLGVREQIASFTTKYAPGEARVKNIHRIADMLRGVVIRPGTTFSVNQFVGPRSASNGFVAAKVIEDGVFVENYGGGISQFATTMFNAAFFGGLDLVEYQAHSLYISRYPYGREATLSYPRPDLRVRNPTPYGVMVWSTYTPSTVTVTLFSTPWVKGEEGEQTVTSLGQCKVVSTERIRRYVDGRTATDRVRAVYRPKEGVDCQGNPTPGATTTTLKPPPTTRAPSSDTTTPRQTTTTGEGSATSAPAGTAAPETSAPATTAAPAPTTAPPATAPATTAPPATAPPTTAPAVISVPPATTAVPVSVIPARPAVTGVSAAPAATGG